MMESAAIQGQPLTTVVVCIRNRVLLGLGKLQAERLGLRVFTAKDGNQVLIQARLHHPELIILGHDLSNPSTEETVARIKGDPMLRGIRVIAFKGPLPNIPELLRRSHV